MSFISSVWKALTAPGNILTDWAAEPLKRWENKREQENKDRDVEREIKKQTGVEEVHSRLKREEASHEAELQIKMQTEIDRIKAETAVWEKDENTRQEKEILAAITSFIKDLKALNDEGLSSIGNLSIDLRNKAHNLVEERMRRYNAIIDEAKEKNKKDMKDALEFKELDKDIFLSMVQLANMQVRNTVDVCNELIKGLNEDLKTMTANIDSLQRDGQKFLQTQAEETRRMMLGTLPKNQIGNRNDGIEDAKVIEE